jgi:archaemetzincin
LTGIVPPIIIISPIGDFDADILCAIEEMVGKWLGLPCRTQALLDNIDFAWDAKRRQFHSTAILDLLSQQAPADTLKVIALTDRDLFIPILTHVYGEAQLGGLSCIVSTHRLAKGISAVAQRCRYLERIVKECAHELGHTFDLRHCKDNQCLMHYCRSIDDVDHKENRFCRYCRVMMGDALNALGVHPVQSPFIFTRHLAFSKNRP